MIDMYDMMHCQFSVMQTDGGGLRFLNRLQRTIVEDEVMKTKYDDIASWVLGRIIELDKLISLKFS
jgi:hypothetical protein